ncbi:MAG: hypothetical protein DRH26_00190 [Deltaproteobacteria bacterium]|nr:MAG: hypothetical protein DRH26_00190 [Deltaproteobacteria bacterium]
MHLSNRIIKAQDVKQPAGKIRLPSVSPRVSAGRGGLVRKRADSREETSVRFIRGICHIPAKDGRENYRDIPAEIKEIRKQTEERIKIAEKNACDRGFSEGLREGIDREKRELSLVAESVGKLIRELKKQKKELLEGSEKEIIDLAFLIAGKVIHKEVSTDREVILSVLRDAMKNMKEREGVRVRLNPGDYSHIIELKPDFLDSYKDILIEKDEEIGQGGVMIETYSGVVDARLDQQLNKIMESLYDEHGF